MYMDLQNIITEKIVFGGNSLGKINGKNVFVPYTLPGEELEVRIAEQKKDYDIAEIVNIVKPSENRVKPECKYYGICGGCNMMHIDYQAQVEYRKKMLSEMLQKNGVQVSVEEITAITGPSTGYRARFQINDGGLSERRKNTIIPVESCLCAESTVNAYFANNKFEYRPKGRCHLFGSEKMVSENGKPEEAVLYIPEEKKEERNIGSRKKVKQKKNRYFAGTVDSPENSITVQIADKKISFDVRGFFQSNLYVFEKTCCLIRDLLEESDNILDMYAGCGSLSVFAKDKAKKITLVEHNRDALVYAEKNLSGLNHTSYGLSGETWVKTCAASLGTFDSIVIDPPRSGMEKAVLDYLVHSGTNQIISMSCDPATHSRDIARLISAGYKIKNVYLLDFYPNTSHIESLIELRK